MHQVGFIYKLVFHVVLKNYVNQNAWGNLSTICHWSCVWYIACWIGRGLLCAVPSQGVLSWSLPDHNHPFVDVFTDSLTCVPHCHPSMACPQVYGKWVWMVEDYWYLWWITPPMWPLVKYVVSHSALLCSPYLISHVKYIATHLRRYSRRQSLLPLLCNLQSHIVKGWSSFPYTATFTLKLLTC